ncbi:MAG: hypothetical protein ACYDC8_16945 [Gammaproteobacteria bacterium]
MSALPTFKILGEYDLRLEDSRAAVRQLLIDKTPIFCSTSFGKDSSATLGILLHEALILSSKGISLPQIVILNGNTQVENPAIEQLAMREIAKIEKFAADHSLPVRIEIAIPPLTANWAFRTIGSGKLPVFPGSQRRSTRKRLCA